MNNDLIVMTFTNREDASKTRQALKMMRGSKFWGLLVNTVIVSRDSSGKVIVQQQWKISAHQRPPGRLLPDMLVDEILGVNPEEGIQRLIKFGLDERFLKKIMFALVPNSSAILIYILSGNLAVTRQVLDALKQFSGTLHYTTVPANPILDQAGKSVGIEV
jgi:uncharacterized membrane protein